jgi:hypothetical protein
MTTPAPATVPGVDATGHITGTTNDLPWAPIPAADKSLLEAMASSGQLGGVPPQLLSYIMQAESGPSYEGGGWNGIAGGWFGLEAGDGGLTQADITSQNTFDQQAQAAAGIYATGLNKTGGDAVKAENYYQTGDPTKSANGAGIFNGYLQSAIGTVLHTQLSPAATIVGDVGTATNTDTTDGGGWIAGVDHLLGDIDSAAWWKRVGLFTLGVGLIIGGIVLFVSTTKTGQTVESDAAVAAVA